MKKSLFLTLAMVMCFVVSSIAAERIEVVPFEWEQPGDKTYLTQWEMWWGIAAGGPYTHVTTLAYNGQDVLAFTGDVTATVSGTPASTVTKYFVLKACGDVPQEGGGTLYECSEKEDGTVGWSNEVSHDFWIPTVKFQVPVQFKVISIPQ